MLLGLHSYATLGLTEGIQFGHEAFRVNRSRFSADLISQRIVRPVATGDDLLRGRLEQNPDYCVDLRECETEELAARVGGAAFEYLKKELYPFIRRRADEANQAGKPDHYSSWIAYWWKPRRGREEFFLNAKRQRMIGSSKVGARPIYEFLSAEFVPNDTIMVFAFDDEYSFGVIQSSLHWRWTKAQGGKVTERIRYTTDVWRTFPWPQDPTDEQVAAVAGAARELRRVRAWLMDQNGWSLRALYQAAEIDGPHPLKDAQSVLDAAVAEAYGVPIDQSAVEFLLGKRCTAPVLA